MDLRGVEPTSVRGVFFRHVPAGGTPLFRPERPADGRWQRGEVVEGFYLAGDERTAWAEWYRSLAELGVPPMRQMPRDLWRFAVDAERIADLSGAGRLSAVGLPPPAPTREQWERYQAVGEALASDGWAGVLYPSAARASEAGFAGEAGGAALCLFRRAAGIAGVEPLDPPERHDEPPAPPVGLRT